MSPGDGLDTAAGKPGRSRRRKIAGIAAVLCLFIGAFVVGVLVAPECKGPCVCPGEAFDGPREAMGKVRLPQRHHSRRVFTLRIGTGRNSAGENNV